MEILLRGSTRSVTRLRESDRYIARTSTAVEFWSSVRR